MAYLFKESKAKVEHTCIYILEDEYIKKLDYLKALTNKSKGRLVELAFKLNLGISHEKIKKEILRKKKHNKKSKFKSKKIK